MLRRGRRCRFIDVYCTAPPPVMNRQKALKQSTQKLFRWREQKKRAEQRLKEKRNWAALKIQAPLSRVPSLLPPSLPYRLTPWHASLLLAPAS